MGLAELPIRFKRLSSEVSSFEIEVWHGNAKLLGNQAERLKKSQKSRHFTRYLILF